MLIGGQRFDGRKDNEMTKPLTAGSKAPGFSLSDNSGATVRLGDFLKIYNVVLVFYPKNNTPG